MPKNPFPLSNQVFQKFIFIYILVNAFQIQCYWRKDRLFLVCFWFIHQIHFLNQLISRISIIICINLIVVIYHINLIRNNRLMFYLLFHPEVSVNAAKSSKCVKYLKTYESYHNIRLVPSIFYIAQMTIIKLF